MVYISTTKLLVLIPSTSLFCGTHVPQFQCVTFQAFYKPLKESGALTDEQLQAIFVNWKDLIVCNTKLQK